jgi:CubicO group peptidase (beta-lactamase class C family)
MNQGAQRKIQSLLDSLVIEGRERGMQVAAYVDGKLVVNAAAGWMDKEKSKAVDVDTLFPVFSCTKGVASTLLHLQVGRGLVSYDTRAADVWPEFAANGKDRHRVRHLMAHMAGLQHMPTGIGPRELGDWDTMCRLLAEAKPVHGPGERIEYHAVTHGWLVGEVARRVDPKRRSFPQILDDEVRKPLGLSDDMFIGVPEGVDDRIAILEEIADPATLPPAPQPAEPVEIPREVPNWMQPLTVWMNRKDSRRAVIPASNGIMTAAAMAKFYAALIPGGVDGVELLPPDRVREASARQHPVNPGEKPRWMSLGYFLGNPDGGVMTTRATCFGHGGYGGSLAYADPECRMSVGLTKNLFSKGEAHGLVLRELRDALGVPQ